MELNREHLITFRPDDVPGLVSFWDFPAEGTFFPATQGHPYRLNSQTGKLSVVQDSGSPFSGRALKLNEGDFLAAPRSICPLLDIHGKDGHLTVVAWIKRGKTREPQCEFIAGQWNETGACRQYGLFLNVTVWNTPDTICGHLSRTGGPTPGYKYCMDGAFGVTSVPRDKWSVIAMSYDGCQGYAWLNGILDIQPMLNPYSLSGGLHDGGKRGSDFTVGAVHHSGKFGNFFTGLIAGLAVYKRALTPAELGALSEI